jgi:hypothetical protein
MKFSETYLQAVRDSQFIKRLQAGIIEMDNSEFVHHVGCFVSGMNYAALRRVSARSRSPLAYGSAVHIGLENYFRGNAKYLDLAQEEAAKVKLDEMNDPFRNTTRLDMLLRSYVLEYERLRGMQFDIIALDGQPMVEQSFSMPLGELGSVQTVTWGALDISVLWTGKIDLLTLYNDYITPVDHKTTSVMGEKFVDDKIRSTQMLGYTFASRYFSKKLFHDKEVFGTRINALASRSKGFDFKVFDIPYPAWKVDEWVQEALLQLRDMVTKIDRFVQDGVATPIREHCVTKYGRCSYFDACDALPTMRDRYIFDDDYFYVSDWSPLAI